MLRIAVVEDEQIYIDQITKYLKRYEAEKQEDLCVTVYRDGDQITAEYKAQFDVIFMDIQMKFVDGMTAAEEIRKLDSGVTIIFITNMTQYAVRGYEVDALDYVLKPVNYFAFSQKLGKAITRIKKRKSAHIVIPIKGGVARVDIGDIYYVESQGHDLIYHTSGGDYITAETMKQAEKVLETMGFCRGNKCYLINLEHVDAIRDKCAIVKGESLQISRPRYNSFMQALTRYWSELK